LSGLLQSDIGDEQNGEREKEREREREKEKEREREREKEKERERERRGERKREREGERKSQILYFFLMCKEMNLPEGKFCCNAIIYISPLSVIFQALLCALLSSTF
jgi:hypothetical protein